MPIDAQFRMRGFLQAGILLPSSFIIVLCFQYPLFAQFDGTTYLGEYEIPVTKEEETAIYEAEIEHWSESQSLKSKLDEIEKQLRAFEQETAAKVDKLLSPRQEQAINEQKLQATRKRVAEDGPFLLNFVKFSTHIAQAKKFTVYEGLPRAKQSELEQIKEKSKTIVFDGFEFYAEPLAGKATSTEQLREILANHQYFSPTPPGGKLCGGFHPDICLQYEIEGQEYRTHICLGCWEILAVGQEQKYSFDYNEQAFDKLLKIAQSIVVNNELKSH